ncbi:MAG: AMP-dependent acyl-CoA synthetase/AMP-acid ligase [Acidimicrobiales bacterium]|nr:AMP-dependent acyl-CoA synthetase/AMP-acid ligase [Acidimicrobiales bacterium]
MNIGLLLEMATSLDEGREIIESGSTAMTGAVLSELATRGAAELAGRHEALVYVGDHGTAFAVALFAAAAAGVPLVPLNYRLPDEELCALAARHPHALVLARDPARLGTEVVDPDAWVRRLSTSDAGDAHPGADDGDAVAVLLYTSGTTSAPKAVVLRHRHLSSYIISTVELGSAEPGERALLSVPPYHIAGVSNLLSNLYAGRPITVLDAFSPEAWLARARDRQITHALVVPTMLARLVGHLDGVEAQVTSLRTLAYGGARTPPSVLERAMRSFPGVDFVHAYGLTETSSTIAVLGPEDHRLAQRGTEAERARLASVGRPVPGIEVEIRDVDGSVVPAGGLGRVWLRGDQVSGEYVSTGSTLDAEGWFDTRDRGRLDEDGYLFIDGRDDDTIIRGAENLNPAEIEDVLVGHPGVADAVVVGLPDEEWGECIAAVVVPSAHPVPIDELRAWASERLRSSRRPDVLEAWDDLPRTATGKVIRSQVVARLTGPAT